VVSLLHRLTSNNAKYRISQASSGLCNSQIYKHLQIKTAFSGAAR
jgi:hypothetical protein